MPTIIIIFGVTGDLMKKKIAPALFGLFQEGKLPAKTKIIGFARRPLSDEGFKDHVQELIGQDDQNFLSLLTYNQGQFGEVTGYTDLKNKLDKIEQDWGQCANKLFYLAVPPENFTEILANLGVNKFNLSCEGAWTRLLIEKPFGHDEASAKALDESLAKLFQVNQIYRLDHYLGKDGVLALKKIDDEEISKIKSIEIKLLETLTVDGRGKFYDDLGALRDVGQNHLLSIFNILTGILPDKLELISAERAQYEGYREVEGVAKDSKTETYFKVKAKLDVLPWQEVEFIFESGKKMSAVKKEVVITYKDGTEKVFPLELNKHSQYVAEYEKLLAEAIAGDETHFLSQAMVEAAWRFIDPIIAGWQIW